MSVRIQQFSIPEYKYAQLQLERGYAYDSREKWEIYKPNINKIKYNVIASILNETDEDFSLLYEFDSGIALLDFSKRTISASISAKDKNTISKHLRTLKTLYPSDPEQIDGKVKVRFWYNTTHGPKNVIRTIAVPQWGNIDNNYESKTLESLNYLINDFKPSGEGGQLIIMNGVPGTGKSYYLRSLLHSWKDWCSAEYVLDPENLFSGGSGYMADLVLKNSYDEESDWIEDEDYNAGKWKLLILEDSGDLLKPDAANHVGSAGLGRLLNLVDGLIGQGLRVLVLITTNEEFDKMNSAVTRDGRTAAKITFNSLSREHASKWLNGSAPKLPDGRASFTLAELYALAKGSTAAKRIEESRGFGFRVPE